MDLSIDQAEIVTKVATNLVEDSLKKAWEKTKAFFKDLGAKDSLRYQTAYETYLLNTKRKNSQIKTIIYRRAPKELYSFYECVGVEYSGKTICTDKITNLFEIGSKIIITGTGGTGKSIMFKHFFLNTIDETPFIPVMIELRRFNMYELKDISLFDTIYNVLCDNGFDLEKKYFEYSMKEGAYVFLLDGFDEVKRDRIEIITSEIKAVSEKYPENKFLISSRPSEEFIGWNDFKEAETESLTKQQALNLIKKIDFDETIKTVFCEELNNNLYDSYRSFASNPLLLNIMLLTFQKHAAIPERLNDFYEEAFVTLFNAHDATKDAYVRDIRSGLGCEEFKLVFSYLCFKSYFGGEFEFGEPRLRELISQAKDKLQKNQLAIDDYLDDLLHSVCMLVKEGLIYRFSHRSFQEYFAAWYTCKLTDDIQRKLLLNWIKESESVLGDAYFQMLYNLQSDKVNKIILCPIIEEVKKIYQENGFSMQLIRRMFDGLTVRENVFKDKKNYSFSLKIKDSYLCKGMLLTVRLNNYPYNNDDYFDIQQRVFEKIQEYCLGNNIARSSFYSLDIDEALSVLSEDEFLESVKWFEKQILFALKILDRCEGENISKKKKVSSILEEL